MALLLSICCLALLQQDQMSKTPQSNICKSDLKCARNQNVSAVPSPLNLKTLLIFVTIISQDICGEKWGEISDFYVWQIWRNLKLLHMWSNVKFLHMTDVEKCVWCGKHLYAVLLTNLFCCDLCCFVAKSVLFQFSHFWTKDCGLWRKKEKYEDLWI